MIFYTEWKMLTIKNRNDKLGYINIKDIYLLKSTMKRESGLGGDVSSMYIQQRIHIHNIVTNPTNQ